MKSRTAIIYLMLLLIPALLFATEARKSETLTGLTSATPCTAANLTDANGNKVQEMLVIVTTAPVNIRIDGGIPTTTATTDYGITMQPAQSLVIKGYNNIARFLVINQTASNGAVVKLIYFY